MSTNPTAQNRENEDRFESSNVRMDWLDDEQPPLFRWTDDEPDDIYLDIVCERHAAKAAARGATVIRSSEASS